MHRLQNHFRKVSGYATRIGNLGHTSKEKTGRGRWILRKRRGQGGCNQNKRKHKYFKVAFVCKNDGFNTKNDKI